MEKLLRCEVKKYLFTMKMNFIQDPALKKQYTFLKVYEFWWWAFYSMVFVYQSIFFVHVGIQVYQIFFNSALSVLFSMVVVNFWSRLSDKLEKKKPFIILGNIIKACAYFYLPFVNSFATMLIYTVIFYSGPNSDAILISYIYKIADYTNPELKKKRPNYFQIYTYAMIRKYGSIGWAAMLPLSGLIINIFGFQINFLLSATLYAVITLIFYFILNENIIKKIELNNGKTVPATLPRSDMVQLDFKKIEKNGIEKGDSKEKTIQKQNSVIEIKPPKSPKDSFIGNIRLILKNNIYFIFIIAYFLASISSNMSSTIFSIFNYNFTTNYSLLGLIWSIGAFIEYPVMLIVSNNVEKYGWEKIVILTYVLGAIRLLLNPVALYFKLSIIWIYFFQIINGVNFGLGWPSSTYGLNSNLKKEQKSLGLTFFSSMGLVGMFVGNIIGQIFAYFITNEFQFYLILYVVAAVCSLVAAIVLSILIFKSKKKKN